MQQEFCRVPPHFASHFNSVFGIMPGQKIFTAANGDGLILFALWWPWGDGSKITLRVGPFSPADVKLARHRVKALSTDWFRLQ